MAQNNRTAATSMATALEIVASRADNSRDTAPASFLQASRLSRRFKFSPSLATVVAELAFGAPETWGSRR